MGPKIHENWKVRKESNLLDCGINFHVSIKLPNLRRTMILIDAIAFGLSVLIIELIVFLPTVDLIDAEPLNDLSAQLLPQPITS